MKKRVVIIHGFDGSPDDNWKPWLKHKLATRGIEVVAPFLPNPKQPKLEEWLTTLSKAIGIPDKYTHFIAHSLGAPTLIHYLARLPREMKVGGVVSVAGFIGDTENKDLKDFSTTDEIVSKAKKHIQKTVTMYSTDDSVIDVVTSKELVKAFDAQVIVEIDKGHFSEDDHVFELPKALDALVNF